MSEDNKRRISRRGLLGTAAGGAALLGGGITTRSAFLAAATGGNLAVEHPASGGTAFVLCLPLAGAQKAEST